MEFFFEKYGPGKDHGPLAFLLDPPLHGTRFSTKHRARYRILRSELVLKASPGFDIPRASNTVIRMFVLNNFYFYINFNII